MRVLRPDNLRCPTSGKRAYPTREECERVIERAWTDPDWQNVHGAMPRRAYQCECGWWHMTHKPKKEAA